MQEEEFPIDVIGEIMSYLTPNDILNASSSCHKWRKSLENIHLAFYPECNYLKQFYPTICIENVFTQ